MVTAALTLFFIAIALIVVQVYSKRAKLRAKLQKKGEGQVPKIYQTFGPLIKYLAGFYRLLPLPGIREWYAHQIERAGLRFELSADEFLAIKGTAVLVTAVVALLVYSALVQNWAIVAALSLIGLVYPDLLLSAAARKREHACLRALPGFLDLLALAVEAGLGFDSAVRKMTEVLEPGPLIREFEMFLGSMSVGKPRVEALREMARKLDLPDFTSFANAVIQATESGASMGPVLGIQSTEMMLRRFERAEKQAYELPVKMLFPLFVFVFPATFLVIIGVLYFQFKASGAAGAF